jgi:hypothetical protein
MRRNQMRSAFYPDAKRQFIRRNLREKPDYGRSHLP